MIMIMIMILPSLYSRIGRWNCYLPKIDFSTKMPLDDKNILIWVWFSISSLSHMTGLTRTNTWRQTRETTTSWLLRLMRLDSPRSTLKDIPEKNWIYDLPRCHFIKLERYPRKINFIKNITICWKNIGRTIQGLHNKECQFPLKRKKIRWIHISFTTSMRIELRAKLRQKMAEASDFCQQVSIDNGECKNNLSVCLSHSLSRLPTGVNRECRVQERPFTSESLPENRGQITSTFFSKPIQFKNGIKGRISRKLTATVSKAVFTWYCRLCLVVWPLPGARWRPRRRSRPL